MTLHFYLARKFILSFIGVVLAFVLLMGLTDLLDQSRRLSDYDVTFQQVAGLAILSVPKSIYEILPLLMVLSTIAMFLALARSSELVVVRAAGRSALNSLLSPILTAAVIGLGVIAILNPVVSTTSKQAAKLVNYYQSGSSDVLSISTDGLWLRDGDQTGQTVIRAENAGPSGETIYSITLFSFTPEGILTQRIEAEKATLKDGAWNIENAKSWSFTSEENPEFGAQYFDTLRLTSSLTQERIQNSFGDPQSISIWDMPDFIKSLKDAGFTARRYDVWFQMELARPLFLVAMVLIAAPFTMRPQRGGHVGGSVLLTVLIGFGMFYLRNFAQVLGENGQIPIAMAAWVPPIAAILLALGLLLQTEDG